jgi:translocation and assembly module TamB
MSRRLRIAIASAVILLGLLIIAGLSFVGVTHTGFGQERVRQMVASMLAGRVKGKVHIGRIHGGFFNGVTIDSVEIRDDEDSLFFASGPVRVQYDARDIFDRRILLTYLEAQNPVLVLRQHEGGQWNFRRIFPPGREDDPRSEGGFGQYIVIDSADIHNASVILTMPWHPGPELRGVRRDSAIAFEMSRPVHAVRRTREGFARTWRWTKGDASLGYTRISDPDSSGRFARIRKASFTESYPPFEFRNISGTAMNLGDSIWVEANHWDLPGSTGSAKGKVVWGSDLPVRYNVHVVGDSVSLRDVAWVYPTLPTTGGGKMELDIRSQRNPQIIDYVLTKMDVRTTRSRLLGRMTFAVGAPILTVKDVDMQAAPMDFDLLRTFNGKEFPYDWQGKITGNVRASGGPLTRFRVEQSSLTFADANVPGAVTRATGQGELDILFPAFTAFHSFNVDVDQLDLRTLQYLNPLFPRVKGIVRGTATLDSSWLDVRFRNADLTHHDGSRPVSHITGNGRVTWGEFLNYDLTLAANPLSFTALSGSYPLLPLRGEYSGPLRIKGTSPNLLVTTTLTGPAGSFAYTGLVDADPEEYGARGRATTTALDLRALTAKPEVPQTRLTGQYDIDLRGSSLPTLVGSAVATIERSVIGGFAVDPSAARLRFANGIATVDTLSLNAAGSEAQASGTFALGGARTGSLRFRAVMDSLAKARALFPALAKSTGLDSLRGRAELSGEVSGTLDRLSLNAVARLADVRYGQRTARTVRGTLLLSDITKQANGSILFAADTIGLGAIGLNSVRATVALTSPNSGTFNGSMVSERGVRTDLAGNLTRTGDTTVIRIDTASVAVDSANRYRLQSPTRVAYGPGSLVLDSLLLQHSSNARLLVRDVRLANDSIRGHVRADSVDLRLFRTFVPGLVEASGAIVAEVDVRGSVKQPRLYGQISLGDGSATMSNLGTRIEHIRAEIALAGDTVHIRRLSAETNAERRGSLSLAGTVSFEEYDNPSFSLNARASNFHAINKAGLASLDISTSPAVTLTGSFDDAVLRGTLRVERGSVYIPEVARKRIIDLEDPELAGTLDTLLAVNRAVLPKTPRGLTRNLTLDNVAIDIGPDVWLRSSEANIKLGGSLNVTLEPGARLADPPRLALEGNLSADRGTYRLNLVDPFVQPTFDVESGTLTFFGTPDLNPALNIRAIHTVRQPSARSASGRDVRVRVTIGGSLARPELTLDNPDNLPLSQSDLLSYLVTGEPAIGLDNTSTDQIAQLGIRYAGNLFTSAIPKNVLDIFELQTAGPGDEQQRANDPYLFSLLNTRAVLGKQLGPRWFLGLSTGLCFVNTANFKENLGLQLEYRISSLYSAQAGIEPGSSEGRCSSRQSTPSFQQTPSQFGFDFFRNWRF